MGDCNKMDGKKMKAGWIGFLREEPDIWKSVEKLSALGYRGLEGGDFLLVGDVDENRKRLVLQVKKPPMRRLCVILKRLKRPLLRWTERA